MLFRTRFNPVFAACGIALSAMTFQADALTFVDPTARLVGRPNITLGNEVFVAPFASIKAGGLLQPVRSRVRQPSA